MLIIIEKIKKFEVGYKGTWSTSGQWWEYDLVGEGTIEGQMEYVLDGGIPQKKSNYLSTEKTCYQKDAINYCQEQSILYSVSYVQ